MQMMAALPDTAPGHAEAAAQGAGAREGRRLRPRVDSAGREDDRSARPEDRRVDDGHHLQPGRHQRENLQQYDAIFLASTTGTFLDDPADPAATAARRKALLDFVRGGKGIAGIHAATDSYHGDAAGAAPAAAADGARDGGTPLWPEFNKLIGGYFKFHWIYPTQIAVKIDDPANPINAPFTSVNPQTGARAAAAVLDRRRGLHLQREFVVARQRARADEHRLREDAGGSEGAGAGAAAHRSRLRAQLHPARRQRPRVRRRCSVTTSRSTRCRRCWRTSSPACSTRSAICRPTTARPIRQNSEPRVPSCPVFFVRFSSRASAATFLVALLTRSTAALLGEGQAPAPASADVAPFVGDWLVAMSMQSIEVSLAVAVKTDGGKVSATISSAGQPTVNVTDISVAADPARAQVR